MILLLAVARGSRAAFSGFPFEANTNAFIWEKAEADYDPIGQLYSGIVERCSVTRHMRATHWQDKRVAAPSIEENWTVYKGTSQTVVVAGGFTYTNLVTTYGIEQKINQLGPFTYSYTDDAGSHTGTGFPFVTRYFMHELDEKLFELMDSGQFVCTNEEQNGHFTNWFAQTVNGRHPDVFPTESSAGLFYRLGIGYTTNRTTNVWGFVTGGDAWFTRQPPATSEWAIAETHHTGGWTFVDQSAFMTNYYETAHPVLRYTGGDTGSLSALTVTIAGDMLTRGSQAISNAVETFAVTSENVGLSNYWFDVTNISVSGTWTSTGDVFAVMYTNRMVLYGSKQWRLTARDLDERFKVLRALQYTHTGHDHYQTQATGSDRQIRLYSYDNEPNWNEYRWGFRYSAASWTSATNDAVDAFKVYTNAAPVEYGRARPAALTYGERNSSSSFDAWCQSVQMTPWVTNLTDTISHCVQFYFCRHFAVTNWINISDPADWTDDLNDEGDAPPLEPLPFMYFGLRETSVWTTANSVTGTVFGQETIGEWCDVPPADDERRGKGWIIPVVTVTGGLGIRGEDHLIKWDFVYK